MKKQLTTLLGTLVILFGFATSKVAAEGFTMGFSGFLGGAETSGTETENSEKNSTDRDAVFLGGSVFVEYAFGNGFALGLDYVPMGAELGSDQRVDSAVPNAAGGAENDTGTRKAAADLTDLITLYTSLPIGDNGLYVMLGYHSATIETTETLPNSKYGNEDINGFQYGIGMKNELGMGTVRYELSYSDFDDISINSSATSGTKIEADADVLMAKIAFAF